MLNFSADDTQDAVDGSRNFFSNDPVIDTSEFIEQYTDSNRKRIEFSWNGKHAGEFVDANQEFRWAVVSQCVANPDQAPLSLLEHLFLADSEWAVQAWGTPRHFSQLSSILLERGGEASLESFSRGFSASFDTFGACHEIQLPPTLLASLASSARDMLSHAVDEKQRTRLEGVLELFEKIGNSTATAGWATIAPGAPVSNIRIVWPRWYHKILRWLSSKLRQASN
jgi:hypothetical protein